MSAFALRGLLIPLAVLRLVQVDMNLSIVFACFIFLKPFMDGLQTGLLASDIQILSLKKSSGNGSFGLGTWSKKNRKSPQDGIDQRNQAA